jgi:hypothetical protein
VFDFQFDDAALDVFRGWHGRGEKSV